jgi:hypothetical protein
MNFNSSRFERALGPGAGLFGAGLARRNAMQIEDKMANLATRMAVAVEIKTGTRRLIEYLTSPSLRCRQESLRER